MLDGGPRTKMWHFLRDISSSARINLRDHNYVQTGGEEHEKACNQDGWVFFARGGDLEGKNMRKLVSRIVAARGEVEILKRRPEQPVYRPWIPARSVDEC